MKSVAMHEVAFELLTKKKRPMEFEKMWTEIIQIMGFTPEHASTRIAQFYTRLTLDGRFVNLGDNVWDLRSRQTFDKIHIDMNDAYSDEIDEEVAEDKEIIDEESDDEEDFEEDDDDADDLEDDYGDGDAV